MRHAKEPNEFTKSKGKRKDELQQQTLETAFQRRDKFPQTAQKNNKHNRQNCGIYFPG